MHFTAPFRSFLLKDAPLLEVQLGSQLECVYKGSFTVSEMDIR
jgi:hypothetical protein